STITVPATVTDVCETGGVVDLTTLVSGSPAGGTFSFTGTGVAGNDFDPTGLSGSISVTVNYTSGGGCAATPEALALNVVSTSTITVPATVTDVCETGGVVDLTTLVSGSPAGGTFSFIGTGVTGNDFDPTGLSGSISVTVNYTSGGGCAATPGALALNVVSTSTITVPATVTDVCETGGVVDLTTLVSGSPAGGTFSFTGTGVTGNDFDPTGLSGSISVTVNYTSGGGCAATPGALALNVVSTSTITVPATVTDVCETGGVVDLTTLVSGSPSGGVFSFAGTGVTGNNFDPTGLSGPISIAVNYTFGGGCAATSAALSMNVLDATNPLCSGGGDCATVSISLNPTPASCALSDGSMEFIINPAIPAINNTGVTITIDGPVKSFLLNEPYLFDQILSAGDYTFEIEYGDPSCIKMGAFTIDQSGTVGAITVDNPVGPVCNGDLGSVGIDVENQGGNILEYSLDGFIWNSFVNGSRIDIPAGDAPTFERTISVRSSAADLCFSTTSVIIQNQFPEIAITSEVVTEATCNNNDGEIRITSVTGGDNSSYTFELDGVPVSLPADGRLSGLSGGDHTFTVIDGSGCDEDITIFVPSPGLVQFTLNKTDPSCTNGSGTDGVIQGQIDASFLPGNYEVAITEEQGNNSTFIAVAPNGLFEFRDLARGRYFITVRSNDGCPNELFEDINDGPVAVSFDYQLSCVNDSNVKELLLTDITGDNSASYLLRVFNNSQTLVDEIGFNLPVGNSFPIANRVFLNLNQEFTLQLVQSQTVCPVDDIVFTHPDKLVPPAQLAAEITNTTNSLPDRFTGSLSAGNIVGGFQPSNNGFPYLARIELDSAAIPGTVFSTEFDTVRLNTDLRFEATYQDIPAGRYLVEISDQIGCTITLAARVDLNTDLFIPNVFTPNGDDVNETFFIRNLDPTGTGESAELVITNRWGKQVYSDDNYIGNWDGEDTPDGVYFYKLKARGEVFTGWVEIIRGQF
ncbi:hypothetical protein FNH22_31575, partial [Fulvivirga sp. M361]|uniref:T9SS type B sorting domain-containing protein n=1 Tax=Fulvivirga sp. M361 TaxID=2594266 RepID=UPI001179A6E1